VPCRAANSRYETTRLRKRAQGDWNGLVDAQHAQRHILLLGQKGMGYKAVARVAGVALTLVMEVRAGRQRQLRARSAKKILSVPLLLAGGQYVPAAPTWKLLNALIADGYPKSRLAKWLGQRGPGLQIRKTQVTVRNAARVRSLYARLTAEASS
jgi:hypothetical protein